jgi:hypothetical protein
MSNLYSLYHPFTKKIFIKDVPAHGRGLLIDDMHSKSKYPQMIKGGNIGTTNLIIGNTHFNKPKGELSPTFASVDLAKLKPIDRGIKGKGLKRNNIKLVI